MLPQQRRIELNVLRNDRSPEQDAFRAGREAFEDPGDDRGSRDRSDALGDPVSRDIPPRETPADGQREGHRGVEVGAGYAAERVDQRDSAMANAKATAKVSPRLFPSRAPKTASWFGSPPSCCEMPPRARSGAQR